MQMSLLRRLEFVSRKVAHYRAEEAELVKRLHDRLPEHLRMAIDGKVPLPPPPPKVFRDVDGNILEVTTREELEAENREAAERQKIERAKAVAQYEADQARVARALGRPTASPTEDEAEEQEVLRLRAERFGTSGQA
jgi:hypothetical protein